MDQPSHMFPPVSHPRASPVKPTFVLLQTKSQYTYTSTQCTLNRYVKLWSHHSKDICCFLKYSKNCSEACISYIPSGPLIILIVITIISSSISLVLTTSPQGGRSWLAFVHRRRIHQSFRRAHICKFLRQKRRFLQLQENRLFVVVKRLTQTQARSLKHPF